MSTGSDSLRERIAARIGQPLSGSGRSQAPDEVNLPMIRHWVDAMDDRNPVYLDEQAAHEHGFPGIVAPPAMLQAWTMGRPRIEGIRERGGAPGDIDPDSPLAVLAAEGLTGTLATNSELEFDRYLLLGDRLSTLTVLDDISERKTTALGSGYFVTWRTTYTDQDGAVVGTQRFRIFKFAPGTGGAPSDRERPPRPGSDAPVERGEELPPLNLDVTPTVVVAGAIASRDFMPVHHDRDYAQAQGAPDIFMNILTSNAYVSRFVTDWSGPAARVRRIAVRLGAPAVPGYVLHFTGHVTGQSCEEGGRVQEVALKAANDLGSHVTGTVTLQFPA